MDENAIRLCEVAGDVFPSAPVMYYMWYICVYFPLYKYSPTLPHTPE